MSEVTCNALARVLGPKKIRGAYQEDTGAKLKVSQKAEKGQLKAEFLIKGSS